MKCEKPDAIERLGKTTHIDALHRLATNNNKQNTQHRCATCSHHQIKYYNNNNKG